MNLERVCYGCFAEKGPGIPCPRCGFNENDEQPYLALPLGTILNGRYLVGKVLGIGGFGITYLGYDLTLEIKVAIKEYMPSALATRHPDHYSVALTGRVEQDYQYGMERFLDEAKILAKLQSTPNIVSVQNYYKENGTAYFVMAVSYTHLEQGELFSLLGVNGAGKTTTIKMLSCLTKPTAGDAFLNGHSIVSNAMEVKKRIGVSPQETAVAPNLTAKENLEMMCGVHGFSKEKKKLKTAELSEAFGLGGILNKKAGKLSGGWQRRLSIAMALISEPQVLFLDEPTVGLDVLARSDLWDVIRSLKGKTTMILTTHYMEEAEALSDRIGIMKDGTLLALGTCEELKKTAGKDKFEDAFIKIVKEGAR